MVPVEYKEELLGLEMLRDPGRVYRDIRFADFDNDGFLDAIANVYSEPDGIDPTYNSYLQLYWGDGKQFVLDTAFASKKYTGFGETIVVADFDNDGYVDVLVPQYMMPNSDNPFSKNLFFKNNRDRTFTELGESAGVVNTLRAGAPEGAQGLDFDLDGLIDIYVGGSLLKNQGGFKFVDITESVGLPGSFDEGIKFFDYDLDGDLDFVIQHPKLGPRLFENASGIFSEAAPSIFPTEYFSEAYSVNAGDVDGDRYDDILIGGGFAPDKTSYAPRFYFYRDGKYVREKLIDDGLGWSDLVSFGDLNNDGAIDLVVRYGGIKVLINENSSKYFIRLTVTSSRHRNQFGRIVKAHFSDGKVKSMVIDGGSGYLSNQPYPLLIQNEGGQNVLFKIYCADRVIEFSASSGEFNKDCVLD